MMKTDPMIWRRDLLSRLVLDQRTTEEIGKVAQLWIDTGTHQVVSVTCKCGFLGRTQRSFGWTQIETIGMDSILVKLQPGVELETPHLAEPVVGSELWTDAGNKVGRLTDYCLDSQTGVVNSYLFTSDNLRGLTEGTYQLSPQAILSIGSKRVMAINDAVQNAERYTEGLGPKIAQAADFIREDYTQTQKDLMVVMEEGKILAGQVQKRAKKFTGQARERLTEVADQVQETTQQLANQVASQAKEQWSEINRDGDRLPEEEVENAVLDDSVFDFEPPEATKPGPSSQSPHSPPGETR